MQGSDEHWGLLAKDTLYREAVTQACAHELQPDEKEARSTDSESNRQAQQAHAARE